MEDRGSGDAVVKEPGVSRQSCNRSSHNSYMLGGRSGRYANALTGNIGRAIANISGYR